MTEVLSIPSQPDGSSLFGRPSLLRHSSSQTSFLSQSATSFSRSSINIKPSFSDARYENRQPASLPSSAPSSPRCAQPEYSNQPSYTSTPSSSLSLEEQCCTEDEDIIFPSYDDVGDYQPLQDVGQDLESPTSSDLVSSDTTILTASVTLLVTPSYLDRTDPQAGAGDDSVLRREPTRHVDYLSHNWKEEDIWSSWKHVVAKRRAYSNSPRLENASWRSWTKAKYRLKTVAPEKLNWMKDHDVTWLYGPLQTGVTKNLDSDSTPPASQLSRTNSFASKKPILKKRSLSELMLQQSLSSSTLMKQATDALRAQQPAVRLRDRPILCHRALSDLVTSSKPISTYPKALAHQIPAGPSLSTSGAQTPCTKRHIHFNNKVEQCIAINKSGDDYDYYNAIADDSSDDDLLMMKPVSSNKAKLSNPSTPRNSFSGDGKTIAMLPSTTLKYRGDTPEPVEQKVKQKGLFWNAASKLSPSPSLETLKPKTPSANFLLDDDDDDLDMNWQPLPIRRNSLHSLQSPGPYDSSTDDKSGMHRTPSGMFMPDDEEGIHTTGILGKVFDTVNTAKDIAHVIWNVGWRA